MTELGPPCLVGVDGGGTACRIAIVAGGVRTEIRAAAANVHSDPDGAVDTLVAGLNAAARQAGLAEGALSAAHGFLGLAGVTGPGVARAIAARLPLGRAEVAEDCLPALVGALGGRDGAVAGIGTGSFFGRQSGGAVDLRGGWGFVLGDEASGAWLGRALLARVLHVQDGMARPSDLTRDALAGFEDGPAGIMAFAGRARPGDYAAFAPRVADAAEAGDPAGLDLMRAGAAHIARALDALGWQPPEPLCLVGGLAGRYAPHLPAPVAQAAVPAQASALDGALRLAARLAGTGAP